MQGVIQPIVKAGNGIKVKEIVDLEMEVFPIPTSGMLNISGNDLQGAKILVYDLQEYGDKDYGKPATFSSFRPE